MQERAVILLDAARNDLANIEDWLCMQASSLVAERFTGRILDRLQTLRYGAERGTARSEIDGLRVISLLPTVSVAFVPTDDAVLVYRILYGGQDWRAALTADNETKPA